MSTVFKAGCFPDRPMRQNVFHFRDIRQEAQGILLAAQAYAEKLLADARKTAEQREEQARREGFKKGLQEGYLKGRREGEHKARAEAQQDFDHKQKRLMGAWAELMDQVNRQRAERLRLAERDLLAFSLDVASRVAKCLGQSNRQVVVENLKEALSLVMDRSDLVIRAHPDDIETLRMFSQEHADQLDQWPHIRFVEDAGITPGGVVIKGHKGEVDASLEQQLQQISDALLGHWSE